ncbi:thioredoxin-related transmembrane protein 2 isoform X1 [Arachis ipaensis]|uniref:thioredoxin-related transmembrane protein 2 isoform X1 n=1 Tax=Arachis ipaensis TaxID=130454 RepID=UPI000A2B3B70|nr:thioredoxin-related transmembrane protein 2 isoform X1 [Arachis ipaensis]XP_020960746.1 thioredoxin-related transmembrane protein 2 isoform X1 [Arachis ipaensis]XP_020960747.1 thioredoxin-related transmembrane protein 2 isoform X1 [Arachis ipaensis]XP_020960748.1 thioredoxin-related transmembrane protein 2 isoform X1 [Arachis ipaensis]XP_020960749.1 thioredoxin-related transmembrane protein 2 isoform X1 [Arachis ipaensis]XP_025659284.1 thioredoxin-related transmembrane protein 2 isoform X1 
MGKESSGNMEQWLNKMASEPYYLFHFLCFFSYLVVRSSAVQVLTPQLTLSLLRREILTVLVFAVLVALKAVREETWEAFIADILFLAKICLFALAFTLDRRIALWYILVFLVIHMLTQQPPSEGLGASTKLTPLQLEGLLTEGSTSRLWLVEFCASYSSSCIRSSRHFPELSITYSNKNLSFGIVDLGLFPNAAEKFGISLSVILSEIWHFMKSSDCQDSWASYRRISYLRMLLKLHAFQSWILRQHSLTLQLLRAFFLGISSLIGTFSIM